MSKGRFGIHGGQYMPETLMNAVIELEEAYEHYKNDPEFNQELTELLNEYANRPSRLYFSELQPAAQHDGGRKCCPAADVQGRAAQNTAGDGKKRTQKPRAFGPGQPPAHRDERRPAAACRHCTRLCQPAQGHLCR